VSNASKINRFVVWYTLLSLLLQLIETFRHSTLWPSVLLLRYNFPSFTKKNVIFISSRTIKMLKIRIALLMVYSLNMRNGVIHRLYVVHVSRLRRCEHLWELVVWCVIPASNCARLLICVGKCCPWNVTCFELFKVLNSFCACSTSQSFHCEHWIIFICLFWHYQFVKGFKLLLKKLVLFIILSFVCE
jgi:hypothetical protein